MPFRAKDRKDLEYTLCITPMTMSDGSRQLTTTTMGTIMRYKMLKCS